MRALFYAVSNSEASLAASKFNLRFAHHLHMTLHSTSLARNCRAIRPRMTLLIAFSAEWSLRFGAFVCDMARHITVMSDLRCFGWAF